MLPFSSVNTALNPTQVDIIPFEEYAELDLTITLPHAGEVYFHGATAHHHAYIDMEYMDGKGEDWLMHLHINEQGNIVQMVDEARHGIDNWQPPQFLISHRVPMYHPLAFSGARHHGMRELERVSDLAQPLSIGEKLAIIDWLELDVTPMQILGIASSKILAQADIDDETTWIIRRLSIAVALPDTQIAPDGLPMDYTSIPLYVIQPDEDEMTLEDILDFMSPTLFVNPMDCIRVNDTLMVLDGGLDAEQPATLFTFILPASVID